MDTRTHTHTHAQACKRYSNTVWLSASTATTILFVKCLEMQLLSPVWTCLRARSGAWKPVCRTYSEVSERRPLKASAAMSEIWFLLRSLGKGEKEGWVHYLGSCYVNVLDLSDKWSWENTSAEVKAGGQEGEKKSQEGWIGKLMREWRRETGWGFMFKCSCHFASTAVRYII